MKATLEVFDIQGRKISTLLKNEKVLGLQKIVWDPKTAVSSGLYFITLQIGNNSMTVKALMK